MIPTNEAQRRFPKPKPPSGGVPKPSSKGNRLLVAGLFAGIGGLELGLNEAGHESAMLCEIEPGASAVLSHHFPQAEQFRDIRKVPALPPVDLVVAGFPCQDLSQAGRT